MNDTMSNFMSALERTAEISCKLEPVGGDEGGCNCAITINGSIDALLNAYEHLSVELFKRISEHEGKDMAQGLHAMVNVEILKGLGIDPAAELMARPLETLAVLGGLFGNDDEEDEEEEAEQNESV